MRHMKLRLKKISSCKWRNAVKKLVLVGGAMLWKAGKRILKKDTKKRQIEKRSFILRRCISLLKLEK